MHFPQRGGAYNEPGDAAFDMSQALGTSVLALSLVTYKVGLIYYLLRGLPKTDQAFNYLIFSLCVVATALAMPFLEKRVATSRAWSALFFLLITAAAFCTTFMYFYVGMEGKPVINTIQAALWATPIPVALRLFFRHVAPRRQPLCFALGLSVAYILTAVLLPLSNGAGDLSAEQAKNWIPLLHLFRNGCALVMALLALRLLRGATLGSHREFVGGTGELTADAQASHRQFLLLLVPILLCFFLHGFLFRDQPAIVSSYGEMTHLITAFLFLAFGFAVTRREKFLLYLLCANVLVAALISAFLAFTGHTDALQLIGDANNRLLLFGGTLVAGRLAGSFRYPALVCSSIFLTFGFLSVGRFVGFGVHTLFSPASLPVLCLLTALCVASVPLLRRIFPLPAPDVAPKTEAHTADRARLFAERGLTNKEKEVAVLLIRGMSSRNMAETLFLSENTVNTHIKSILRKFAVSGRKAFLALFIQ
jgi:DNA-binding CsgD family transcriptional regulator